MLTLAATLPCFILGLTLAGPLPQGQAATPPLTYGEQEVIETLLQQDIAVRVSKKLVIGDTATLRGLRSTDNYDKLATDLRKETHNRDPAFKEALEAFPKKNKNDAKIIFPTNAPTKVELVSKVAVEEIFSAKHDANPNGWARFYLRFPDSGGLITISQVGIDSKGTVAIVYLGIQSHYRAGGGRIRVLYRGDKMWVLSDDKIGPEWVS
jgi:hypothetical protein